MRIEHHCLPSEHLGHGFEVKLFGHGGKPLLVFPCSQGRFFDYENFGMVEALREPIEAGSVTLVCVDSRDGLAWHAHDRGPHMGEWHYRYELCITREVVPWVGDVLGTNERLGTTGNSFGAFHALNFALKFPGLFDLAIGLSGVYSLGHIIGDYWDDSVYFNDIPTYLERLWDPAWLAALHESYVVLCHGRGAWEIGQEETGRIAGMLAERGITCWHDVWGTDYPHDWGSWREQMPKFLADLERGVIGPGGGHGPLRLFGPERVKRPRWAE